MLSSVVNLYGSEPVWRTSARFFASEKPHAGDLRVAADAVGEVALRRVDLRERLDLAIEHDREVLRRAEQVAALVEAAGDPLELLAARAGELHQDDRALARIEVCARSGQLQVGTRQLGDRLLLVVLVVLEQVPGRRRGRCPDAGADDGVGATRDDDGLLGDPEDDVLLLRAGNGLRRDSALLRRLRVEEGSRVRSSGRRSASSSSCRRGTTLPRPCP